MKKTKTVTKTKEPKFMQERTTEANLPARIGPQGIIEPEIVPLQQVNITIVGGEVTGISLDRPKTIREICRDPKSGLSEDMEFFVNNMDATLDTIVNNGDSVVGLDRFDAGM